MRAFRGKWSGRFSTTAVGLRLDNDRTIFARTPRADNERLSCLYFVVFLYRFEVVQRSCTNFDSAYVSSQTCPLMS